MLRQQARSTPASPMPALLETAGSISAGTHGREGGRHWCVRVIERLSARSWCTLVRTSVTERKKEETTSVLASYTMAKYERSDKHISQSTSRPPGSPGLSGDATRRALGHDGHSSAHFSPSEGTIDVQGLSCSLGPIAGTMHEWDPDASRLTIAPPGAQCQGKSSAQGWPMFLRCLLRGRKEPWPWQPARCPPTILLPVPAAPILTMSRFPCERLRHFARF